MTQEPSFPYVPLADYLEIWGELTGEEEIAVFSAPGQEERVDLVKRLIGVVSLRELLSSEDDERVAEVMIRNVITVRDNTDQEEAAKTLETYDLSALPVVDEHNHLLGIVTFDDVIDVIREEQTEDVYKMAAMLPGTERYLDSSVWDLVKKRIPWLAILLLTATLTAKMLLGL